MLIDPTTKLQELGKDLLTARRFFRRFGVEVDAEPAMTLSEACVQAGISHGDFLHSLRIMSPEHLATPSLEDWAQSPPADLARHIVQHHHAYARLELGRLEQQMGDALRSESRPHPELLEIREPFLRLKKDLLEHMLLEEEQLFPAILAREGSHPLAIRTLEDLHGTACSEHAAVVALFQDIAVRTGNFQPPLNASPSLRTIYCGLRNLEEDLVLHLYLENNLLFPMAVAW